MFRCVKNLRLLTFRRGRPCRIAVFSVTVLRDERIVVVAEQRPDSTEEDSFQWMSRVLQVGDRKRQHVRQVKRQEGGWF